MGRSTIVDKPNKVAKAAVRPDEGDRWLELFSLFIHDLESPLASMKYVLHQAEAGKFDLQKPAHQRLLKSSQIALERAESILYDIISVARAGAIGVPVELSTLVPTAVIQEAIDLGSASAQENGIEITFTNNSGEISVQADPKLLKRLLDNLIYNALRHTPQGGKIAVYTEPAKNAVYIHVKDSGAGLGDIDSEKLFEKFGQVELRASGKHRGVGLGLYFCRLAAEGMGGTIIADDHPKGGAVFSVRLKKAEE